MHYNDKYSFEKTELDWRLYEKYTGKDIHGKAKIHTKTTYHATLRQVCNAIVDREAGSCADLTELKQMLERRECYLEQALKGCYGDKPAARAAYDK